MRRALSFFSAITIALLLYFLNPFGIEDSVKPNALGITNSGRLVLAFAGLMITLWVTEALPMPVVALFPLVLFPFFKIAPIKQVAASFGHDIIFLFLGGFMLGLAIEKWNLHRRIALNIIRITGTSGDRIVLGFILATGLLSMWLSNTATTMMMFPIALSVIYVMKENHTGQGNMTNFSLTIMLAIAYASNIGGIATTIGTPPNTWYVGYFKDSQGYEISFIEWLMICGPLAIILLISLYFVMVKWLFPNRIKSDHTTKQLIQHELAQLGPISIAEKRVLYIFIGTAFLWITRTYITDFQNLFELDDSMIAVMCGIALFICPAGQKHPSSVTVTSNDDDEKTGSGLLVWKDTQKMAWGILLLFGGGIALANALEGAGLINQLGAWLAQFTENKFLLMLTVVIVSLFVSEVMSNIAQVIVFAPVVTSLAINAGMDPLLLGIPMTLAASCACMLPMGTPPNAIVFASGHIKLKHMTRAGFVMNIVSVILITLFCWFLLPLVIKSRKPVDIELQQRPKPMGILKNSTVNGSENLKEIS